MAPRCQCEPTCKDPLLKGRPFCAKHNKRCTRKARLSGSEPPFDPNLFNKNAVVQDSHNCFAYAFSFMDRPPSSECNEESCDVPFHQPGRKSGFPKWGKVKGKRCPDLVGRLMGDVPNLQLSSFEQACPKGFYKIAAVVDPKNDYHFYRQDSNGMWTHKPGSTKVTTKDASDRPIYDPSLCDRDYTKKSHLNYNRFCSFMCVPRKTKKLKRGGAQRQGGQRRTFKSS